MGALISSNTLRLEPDGLSYQTAKVQLPVAPSAANTMVFYYKAYVNEWPENTVENGSTYAWNNDAFFGLSFNDTVSANVGGIVGFTNTNQSEVGGSLSKSNWSSYFFHINSGFSQTVPFSVSYNGASYNLFSYGHPLSTTTHNVGFPNAIMCLSTNTIGLTGAQKRLGIIKIAKNTDDPQKVVFSYGNNYEGLSAQSFSFALTSNLTTWAFQNISLQETGNFRPNYLNPNQSNTINFPRWIVAKWPSAVIGRNLVITDIKVEYYL